jgi:hypothetical protein
MKASYLKPSFILLFVILALGFVLTGCKKEIPPPQEPAAKAPPAQDQAEKEKEFLSAPDAVTCKLEKTTVSKLDLPKNHMASFVHRMERENKQDIKEGRIILANRQYKILLGEKPEREFYIYDIETGIGPYWWGSWSLHSYHKIGDKFIELLISTAKLPPGNKKTTQANHGGKGGWELEKAEFSGRSTEGNVAAQPVRWRILTGPTGYVPW